MLTAIDAAILALMTGAEETQVLGRRVRKSSLRELRETRAYYAGIARDDADDGTGSTALTEFGDPA